MWQTIYNEFYANPRDVETVPTTSKIPIWFYVYADNGRLFIDCARTHKSSSQLPKPRKLDGNEKNCAIMFDFYQRRKGGEKVSKEVSETTHNQVYWYGIFAAMGY